MGSLYFDGKFYISTIKGNNDKLMIKTYKRTLTNYPIEYEIDRHKLQNMLEKMALSVKQYNERIGGGGGELITK